MADSIPLGVQSYCFRGFQDGASVAAKVKEIGLSRIELCVRHADFWTPAAFPAVLEAYRAAGVEAVSIGVNPVTGDEAKDRSLFEFCRAAGARHMSVDFAPDDLAARLRTAEKLSEEYGVLCGIHVHGGRHWLGSGQALRWVFSQCSKRIGLCLDTAWAMDAGEDPVKMIGEFGDRLHLLHLKDFIFDRAGRPDDVVVGTGNLDLQALQKALRQSGFRGLAILEYEGDVNDPVPALKECVNKLLAGMTDLKA